MGPFRSLSASLLLLASVAWPSAVVYAHEQTDPRPGLSEAARIISQTPPQPGGIRSVQSLSGQFHHIFGDSPSAAGGVGVHGYVLIDDLGEATELIIEEQTLRALGGPRAINQQRITVTGKPASAPAGMQSAFPLLAVQTVRVDAPARMAAAAAAALGVNGPQPWATILCKFSDYATTEPKPPSFFQTLMLGPGAPSLDHFWRENSYDNVNLTGSAVYGWFTLPNPRSYYVYGSPAQLDFGRAFTDCTGVSGVSLTSFVGVNLMFNAELDGFAWGGTWFGHRTTWVPPWGYQNQGPIAHEMGHGFGLHHSSGPYAATYDSRWDVMSDIWDNCPPYDATYGCVGVGTIAYHKDSLGWIPSGQRYVASPGTSQTILMERLDQPTSGNYLMAKLPIGGSPTNFYTVEVRRFAGYDAKVPGAAVVLHRVDTTVSDRNAKVVDNDNNGNPNDGAAMWLAGETFVDAANQFTVAVDAQVGNGFQVTITNGVVTPITYTLSVTVTGTGTVSSTPAGINNCAAGTCVASFNSGTSVTLSVTSGNLTAWGGSCAGSGSCVVSMTQNRSVTATFGLPATITASPTTLMPGSSVTATWSGIGSPTTMDWIGLYVPGSADTTFVAWMYVSCLQVPGGALAAGSCPLVIPNTLTPGTYELRLMANNSYVRLATSNPLTVTAAAATMSASPATVAAGGGVTATWSGITSPTTTDWIGLYPMGAADTAFVAWIYVSCSQAPGSARAAGSCAFTIPATVAGGSYELRLFSNNGYTKLATSNAVSVTASAGTSLGASPTTVAAGSGVTATWSGIATPMPADWIGLYPTGAADTAYVAWIYVSCSKTAGAAAAAGSCVFPVPTPIAGGTYELRLFANNGYTKLATSNAFTVTAGLSVTPTSAVRGGSVTATWGGLTAQTSTDWIGLYPSGAGDTAYVAWIYVSCSKTPAGAAATGSCAFAIPSTIAPGSYTLRLFSANGYTKLATSNTLTVN